MSSKVWAGIIGTAAVAAGVALYFLAQEEEEKEIAFDPKTHTKEKLIEVLNQFEIEYASLYIHWYSMLKSKEKEVGKGNISAEVMEGAKRQLQKLTESVDEDVLKENGLTKKLFEEWVQRFEKDLDVKKLRTSMEENFELLLQIRKPIFKFEYPKEITKEKYIRFIKVSYSKFRYDTYLEVQKYMKENGKNKLTDDEFNDIIQKWSLPNIKTAVYNAMNFPILENEKPTKTALKAYLKMMEDDEAWHKDILHIQKEHKQILFSLAEGAKLQGMHEDPLEVLKAELKAEARGEVKPPVVDDNKETNVVVEEPKKETVEAQKKSVGAFSFLGSDEKQKKLVEDFINRNKKKDDSPVPEIVSKAENKLNDSNNEDKDNKILDAEEAKEFADQIHDEIEDQIHEETQDLKQSQTDEHHNEHHEETKELESKQNDEENHDSHPISESFPLDKDKEPAENHNENAHEENE